MDQLLKKHQQLLAQARMRVAICSFMGLYYLFFGITNHPVYLIFVGYSLLMLFSLRKIASAKFVTPYATLIVDNGFSICGLHVTGESGAFLLFFLIHISFAYGVRFGQRYLLVSLLLACSGVAWLYEYSIPWQGRIHFLLSFLFGMPFISFYVYSLTAQLRESENRANESSARTSALLAFLTHDIRAPIQYVLEAASFLSKEPLTPRGHLYVGTIKKLAGLMASMAGRELRSAAIDVDSEGHALAHDDKAGKAPTPLYCWLLAFSEIYRAAISDRNSKLEYELDGSFLYFVSSEIPALERILGNIYSNAIRYCEGGFVLVKVSRIEESMRGIRIEIQNYGVPPVGLHVLDDAVGIVEANLAPGAGLGLKAIRQAAQSIGAKFVFSEIGEGRFSSILDIQLQRNDIPFLFTTAAPVLGVIRQSDVRFPRLSELSEFANVYLAKNLLRFLDAFNAAPDKFELIFLLEAGVDYGYAETSICRQVDWPTIMLCDTEFSETIRIDGSTIWASKNATLNSWKNALMLAEKLIENGRLRQSEGRSNLSPLQGKRILMLDDNVISLSILNSKLAKEGVTSVAVATIAEAEKEMCSSQFDVVIADWNIGVTKADAFLRRAIAAPKFSQTRFLVLSADVVELEKIGLNLPEKVACLAKPVSDTDLLDALYKMIGHMEERSRNLSELSPSNIFNSSLFFEYECDESGQRLVRSLLLELLTTVSQALDAWEAGDLEFTKASLAASLHKLASMCYSAGVYALGDEFKKSQDAVAADTAQDKTKLSRSQLSNFRKIFDTTSAHVRCFLFSLDAR